MRLPVRVRSDLRRLVALATVLALLLCGAARSAAADAPPGFTPMPTVSLPDLADPVIFGDPDDTTLRLQSFNTRLAYYVQHGAGYQSQAAVRVAAPGSERAIITEPMLEAIVTQGPRVTHRFFVPADVVTAASPDADDKYRPDVMSTASRLNKAIALDWDVAYRAPSGNTWSVRNVFHIESMYRSWTAGAGWARDFEQGATTVAGNLQQVSDWFDVYTIQGRREGHDTRSSSNANVSITRVLTPTTVAHVNYGVTLQEGELSNTWNSVPMVNGFRGQEFLPSERQRHAFVLRGAQWLPWNGAFKLFYRLYIDDWGMAASTLETSLSQRITPWLYLRASYRWHVQSGVSFFTTQAPLVLGYRTADSDLAPLTSQDVGGKVVIDLPLPRSWESFARELHLDAGYDRYLRTNDLTVDLFACGAGFRFN
jgi:hypothetical protein